MNGRVLTFDQHEGLGEIEADDGARYPFHCTAIIDGTRDIPIGVAVAFELVAGLSGHWEATDIART